ncbi:hypothetical protein BU17DRAFT_38365 [Hysterangium stoloniferum]|nr:hypothetical protein BU17DRAFT_38365 [Hysterangium stoloniferum]
MPSSSSSSSSTGTRSPSPSPRPVPEKSKSKAKDKGKSKATVQTTDIRNEGVDPNWAYKPPNGMFLMEGVEVDEDFDWDALAKDDDKELWIIRVPHGFKTKNLDGLDIPQPASAPGTKLTTIERKRITYDIWSVDPPSNAEELEQNNDTQPPRGEELKSLSCLLPRKKKKGNWYIASMPISQHMIITHAPATPHVDDEATPAPSVRHSVPTRLLKHRFLPYGASTDGAAKTADSMDVDLPVTSPKKSEKLAASVTGTSKKSPSPDKAGKKRKSATGENETLVSAQKIKKVKL